MTKLIVGSYPSNEEAVKAVNIYELEGHHAKNMIMLTHANNKDTLENLTDVAVAADESTDNKEESFTEKVKHIITHHVDFSLDTHEKLVHYGLSDEEAESCLTHLELGKIVVLADDELKMGQR